MIEIKNLTKRFGKTAAVEDVSIAINPGESVALWGTNGAGKTTIIRCVLGLLSYRGKISVDGFCATKRGKQARMRIGYVPQELGFHDDLRVVEAIRFFAKLKAQGVVDVPATLDRVGLRGHEQKRIRELSGGMKQRLALAIALLGDPSILILDEVTASLDACGRDEFVQLLAALTRNTGRAMLFASHRTEEIASLATRVVELERGRVKQDRPAGEFIRDNQTSDLLHLFLNPSSCDRAIELLKMHGIAASLNGKGIFVPVQAGQRSAALALLADAEIPVRDFEFIAKRGVE